MPQTPGSGTLFPTALDNFTQPTPVNYMDLVSHAGEHDDINSAAMAIEAKLGIGNSSPSLAAVLVGTGTGSSGWTTTPEFASLIVDNGITVLAGGIQVTGNSAINGTLGVTGALTLNNYAAHTVLVGEAASAVVGIAPGATAGVALISGGAAADPSYGTVVVAGGGTGRTTLTNHAILVGATAAAITMVAAGATSGMPLISQGSSADPVYGTAVVAGGGTGAVTLANHGVLLGQATAAIVATATGASGIPLIGQGASADPVFGTAVVAGGGTGLATLTTYAVVCGGTTATGNMQQVSGVGTNGQVLTSGGAGVLPTWTTLSGGTLPDPVTVAHGGSGLATLATYALLCGGTTATGNLQQVSGLGTSGQVLVSNGAGALPTWQTKTNAFKELGAATSTSSYTTTSSTQTDVTGLTLTFTPDGTNPVYIDVCLPKWSLSTITGTAGFYIIKDGSTVQSMSLSDPVASDGLSLFFRYRDSAPTNASHTYKVQVSSNDNVSTLTINGAATTVQTITATQVQV